MSDITMRDYLHMHPALESESIDEMGRKTWVYTFDKNYEANLFALRIASDAYQVNVIKRTVFVTECPDEDFGCYFSKDILECADNVI